jgi:hypothetical protein
VPDDQVLDAHATRFVDAAGDVDAAAERTVREFLRDAPCCGEPAVHAYLRGAVGSDVAAPQVVFAGAVDVGFEALADRRDQCSLEAASRCGELVSQFVSRNPPLPLVSPLTCSFAVRLSRNG